MRVVAAMSAIASAPILALILLMAAGWASLGPALLAVLVTLVVALGVTVVWSRDVEILAETIRQVGSDRPANLPASGLTLVVMQQLGRDVERLARRVTARAALVEQLRRADEAILQRLPDPLIVLAADRTARRANSAARAAFGSDMSAVLRHPDLRGAIDRAFASRMTETADITLPVPVPREVHAAVVPMDPPLSDGGQAMVVLSDRTRERAVERTRADFIANASHELRTPLASLIGFIDTLRGPAKDDPPAQQRFLAIMSEQAARMNRLIDNLLSLSRIEMIEHQAPSDRIDLTRLIPRVVAGFEPRLHERSISVDVHLAKEPMVVLGDADQLVQVVQNLLDNAVKYGRQGSTVRLEVAAASPGEVPSAGLGLGATRSWPARPGVVVTITDQGSGIPREHLPRLTERFYRVDTGRSRAAGGTGLGLAIVKHIVNRHRGQLVIESEEGIGTTVSVWLPLAVATPVEAD